MSSKNRTRRTTTRNIRFPNQMIEQINIALDLKGSGNFSAWVIEACRRRLSTREHIHQLKVMKNEHPAFFPPNRTIL
ncbi:YlcI/YnfO family protein [Escherichia coli]|nr:YlcI/YnfO family protein [Escherichia coli]